MHLKYRLLLNPLFILLLVGSQLCVAVEPWPTTRFEVFVGTPFVDTTVGGGIAGNLLGPETLDDADEVDLPHPSAVMEMEKALHEAALWFKKKGFPPPLIDTIVDTDAGPAYRVYLCKYHGEGFLCGFNPTDNSTSSGMYSPQCAGDPTRSRFLYLNRDKTIIGMGPTEVGYQTIAHELTHAITANTAFGRQESNHCGSINRWITEGIADAIGYDMLEELWQGRYQELNDGTSVAKRHGYRPYLERLPQDRDLQIPGYQPGALAQGHYGASSFWRFLADSHPTGWANLLNKSSGKKLGLLDKPLTSTSKDWRNEVNWLNEGLRRKFSHNLREMYGLFVNNFAFRLAPFDRYQGSPAEDNLDHWAGVLFGPCASIDFPASGKQDFNLKIKGLATACVWVEPVGIEGPVQISFIARNDDPDLLQDISVGLAGTTLLTRPDPVSHTPDAATQYVASWPDISQNGATRNLYLFTNLATDPSRSTERELTVTAVLPGNDNSARSSLPLPPQAAPRPQEPTYKRHARTLSQQKKATTQMVHRQMQLDKKSLNPNVSRSTQVRRYPRNPPCPEPFKYHVCGEHMLISLTTMPGTYIGPAQTNTTGGGAGQVFSGMQAMAQTSLFDSQERMTELVAVLDTVDGSEVSIQFPMVDYGYTGTQGPAAITVTMAGGKKLNAIGPPDETDQSPLTGSVTIEEYSPAVMIGSFVAPLGEFVEGPGGAGIYQSRGTVTGRFTSARPFLADERAQPIMDSIEQMTDDMATAMGIDAEYAQSIMKFQTPNGPPTSSQGGSGSSSGGGMLEGDCSCECEMKPLADELCAFYCEEEFAACDAP